MCTMQQLRYEHTVNMLHRQYALSHGVCVTLQARTQSQTFRTTLPTPGSQTSRPTVRHRASTAQMHSKMLCCSAECAQDVPAVPTHLFTSDAGLSLPFQNAVQAPFENHVGAFP